MSHRCLTWDLPWHAWQDDLALIAARLSYITDTEAGGSESSFVDECGDGRSMEASGTIKTAGTAGAHVRTCTATSTVTALMVEAKTQFSGASSSLGEHQTTVAPRAAKVFHS